MRGNLPCGGVARSCASTLPPTTGSSGTFAIRRLMRVFVSLVLLSVASVASAQPSGVLVIATHEGSPPVPRALLTELAALRLDGAPLVLGGEAVSLYRDSVSREPSRLSADAFDELSRNTRRAIRHVALRETDEARVLIANLLASAEAALDMLNREEEGARAILDACLSLARSYLENGSRDQAEDHALACRRLVPDLAPTQTHPPEIHELLRDVDARLARMRASIRVESEPSSCPVFVNGRELGVTPFEIRAPQGAYRLQVVCGSQDSRVHTLLLGSEPARVRIDVALDRALRTDQQLALVYPDADSLSRLAHEHIRVLAADLQLPNAVAITNVEDGWRVDRVSLTGVVEASVWVPVSPTVQGATMAIAALRERRSLDLTSEAPRERAPWTPVVVESTEPTADSEEPVVDEEEEASAAGTTPTRLALGITATTVGVAALGASLAFRFQTRDAAEALKGTTRLTPGYVGLLDDFESSRRRGLAFAGVAGLTLATGIPLLALRRDTTPWWSWVLGASGLAAVTVGVITLLQDRECLDSDCAERSAPETRGALWLAGGLPLLVLPFAQLRGRERAPVHVSFRIESGLQAQVTGWF